MFQLYPCEELNHSHLLENKNEKTNWASVNLQVLQQPEGRSLGGRVIGGITQRLAARLLKQVLRTPVTVPSSTS